MKEDRKSWITWAAIFLSLLALIYIPTFIWSPPWSINGYYLKDGNIETTDFGVKGKKFSYFKDGLYKPYYLTDSGNYVNEINYVKHKNRWQNMFNHKKNRFKGETLTFKEHTMTYKALLRDQTVPNRTAMHRVFIKTSNPITVWYIKWLEWAH